ncbi:MAG: FAD-dependent oxidoreductase [Candidatus Ozemobacteraceae bacterium]
MPLFGHTTDSTDTTVFRLFSAGFVLPVLRIFPVFLVFLVFPMFLAGPDTATTAAAAIATSPTTSLPTPSIHDAYDVIVIGGDPEGISASIAAARAGAKTLLIDTRTVPGGLFTQGWLNVLDMNRGPDHRLLNKGLFNEWFRLVEGEAFSIDTAVRVFRRLLSAESRIDTWFGVQAVEPLVDGLPRALIDPGQSVIADDALSSYMASNARSKKRPNAEIHARGPKIPRLTGVRVHSAGNHPRVIAAHICIDATQDGDIAAAAGADFTLGREDLGGLPTGMAVTLVFRLDGIGNAGWEELLAALQRGPFRGNANAFQNAVWGFSDVMKTYRPSSDDVGVRGLNIGRQRDGSILINALHLYGIDGLDPDQRKKARERADHELPSLVSFLRDHIPGFGKAFLAGTAPELYVRETRHFTCLYRLSIDDVLENRVFSDTIAYGSYPLDVQAIDASYRGDIVGKPACYGIPLRCLVPIETEGLLICGRTAGFDSLAHSSARVVPVGMAVGQAAGITAALSVKGWVSYREGRVCLLPLVSKTEFVIACRRELSRQGVELGLPPIPPPPETRHWAYSGLQYMRRRGLASGGYENYYALDEPISGLSFMNGFNGLTGNMPKYLRKSLYAKASLYKTLTLEAASDLLLLRLGRKYPPPAAEAYLRGHHVLDATVISHVEKNQGLLSRGAAFMLLKNYQERFPVTNEE